MSERTDHGFRTGIIEASAGYEHERGAGVLVRILDSDIWIEATPAGRRVRIRVRQGIRNVVEVQHTLWSSEG